jgi:phosphohistidine phosphatase SixA
MLLLVRHAHAGDKRHWQGPDSLRPLSTSGQAEAAGLLVRLEDYPIGCILSSPTVRCQQTVQPLALDRLLGIEALPALGVEADLVVVLALLGDLQAQDAVVCTHGEVIGQVLVRLVADGLMVDQPLAWPKGSTWLLDGADRRFTVGRYLPPLGLVDALTPSAPQAAPANGLAHTGQQAHHPSATLLSMIRDEEM